METELFLEDVEGSVVIVAMSTKATSLYYNTYSVALTQVVQKVPVSNQSTNTSTQLATECCRLS